MGKATTSKVGEGARRQERLLRYGAHILAVLIVIIGALDCFSTELALGTGNAMEANPIVRWMQDVFGAYWVWPKMAIHTLLAIALLAAPSWSALVAMGLVSMLTLAAALNNLAILHAHIA